MPLKYTHRPDQPGRLLLWDTQAALEITCPLAGVLRVRHAPQASRSGPLHPDLTPKTSWAVVHTAALPLTVTKRGENLNVVGGGVSLDLDLTTGQWTFRGADGRLLARATGVRGQYTARYPVDDYRSTLELHAPPGEAYLGFGQKVGPLDKRGLHFTFWNTDVVPHHPDTDPLYQSIPMFLGLRDGAAWGLFLDESWRSEVDVALAHPERLTWETWGPELDVYLISGPGVEEVVGRYTALTGRPPLPPLWSLGAQQSRWGYENADEIRGVIEGYRARQLPLDCVYLDVDYMDGYKVWTFDPARYPDPAALAREAAEQGVKLVTIVDPGVKLEVGYAVYDEGARRDAYVRLDRGDVLVGEVWPKPAVFPDFTREDVQRWWGEQHQGFADLGIAGFWNDMNEPSCFSIRTEGGFTGAGEGSAGLGTVEGKTLPYDARHGTRRHLEVHNVYALGMARATFEGLRALAPERRPFVLTRAGFAGIQRYSAVWTGDNSSHWSHLETSVPMLLGLGLSGVAFTGADIPGFAGAANGELLARWTQLGVFYPLMRNHAARGTPPQEPWRFGEPYLSLCREALERRYRLLPTLYTLMQEANMTGLPVMRPLVMYGAPDPDNLAAFDQFLFGRDLLIAPVVRPGQSRRLAYLPQGEWLEFANLAEVGGVVEGGQHVIASAPLETTPVWLRAGGAVALTGPAQHTTGANWEVLAWHVHAAPQVAGRLYEDDGEGYGEGRTTTLTGTLDDGAFTLTQRIAGTLPWSRAVERVHVYGLPAPQSVNGARRDRYMNGVLELEVDAGWERLVVRL